MNVRFHPNESFVKMTADPEAHTTALSFWVMQNHLPQHTPPQRVWL